MQHPAIAVVDLGRTTYAACHALQRELQAERIAAERGDLLIFNEHEPVFTLGRAHEAPSLRVGAEQVAALGIPIVATERGGDITYHGPGQIVVYGIIDLREAGIGPIDYVTALEDALIATLAAFDIEGRRVPGKRGIWAPGGKIASIGINVRRGVTMHGLALNVEPDLAHFELINPCGMADVAMTSMVREAGAGATQEAVARELATALEQALGRTPAWEDAAPYRERLARSEPVAQAGG